jgi:hypothetical protein
LWSKIRQVAAVIGRAVIPTAIWPEAGKTGLLAPPGLSFEDYIMLTKGPAKMRRASVTICAAWTHLQ